MTDCKVVCRECRTPAGPRVWRWLCEECAEECLARHRRDTGHTDVSLMVTTEPTMADLRRQIVAAARVRRW